MEYTSVFTFSIYFPFLWKKKYVDSPLQEPSLSPLLVHVFQEKLALYLILGMEQETLA